MKRILSFPLITFLLVCQIVFVVSLPDIIEEYKDEEDLLTSSYNGNENNYFQKLNNPQNTHQQDTVNLCFPEKYRKYEKIFSKAYNYILNQDNNRLMYSYYQNMEDYVKSFSLYHCDVAMVEPTLYDQYYNSIKNIYREIEDVANERMADSVEGEAYSELFKDLTANKEHANITALPLFLDYGILYYRTDLPVKTPTTWDDISNVKDILDEIDFPKTDTIFIGQFNEYREFFYNLFENILNTRNKLTYKNIEKEANSTIGEFKYLFDNGIIDEYAWHLNSEYGVIRFNEGKAIFMRNWSSFYYNVTTEFQKKNDRDENKSFQISKMVYEQNRFTNSRTINKGIYICVPSSVNENVFDEAVKVVKTFTSKEFMKQLIQEDDFYDLPVYSSLIEQDGSLNNKKYCDRINCGFYRDIAKDHILAPYSAFYQEEFLEKFNEFFDKAKGYFKDASDSTSKGSGSDKEVKTLQQLMSVFSDYFQDKYVELGSTTTIIMIIIVAIELIITSVVTYYLIKHRNFIEIRRSSPLFLINMLVGIMLAFVSILTFIGKPTKFICILRPYILVLTFGLTFFSLLLKTFRIKVIFDKINFQVKDSNLIMYLCILLGIELTLVTIWSSAAGMEPDVKKFTRSMHYYICKNTSSLGTYIQTSLIVINGLALVYGCYLVYKVKNVYSEYNESKVIGLSIYGIVICMIILMFIVNIKGLDHTTLFLIQSLMIILSADIILVFMFTPKLWKLHINIISELPLEKPAPVSGEKKASEQPDEEKNVSIKNITVNSE
ncbi:hypothetical protein BCR36DRAFT_353941 [Piromyces finnis]|uniref:G-protein coupled receptors family 3 profile domain-containing protein n=1 Tax=Piromyces finnis TaxID=1754191 RepID=A0A1Y1V883_9FUNG|nr:hypothetical protein BCR36DRAFT_353941 [Piromyces finnis]|eukprot:ORX48903.1 hypothetical protein BCR36DRAFT_353941 [Piromyces finnis]